MEDVKKLAEQHWDWVGGVLERLELDPSTLELARYLYTTSFVHGWKHCAEGAAAPLAQKNKIELKEVGEV